MNTRFFNNNSKELIIFLTGWFCDDNQFKNIKTNKDLLLCWDYTTLEFNHNINFNNYTNIYLITYSAGVFVAGLIQNILPKFTKKIAINGSPLMFDKHFGIPEDMLKIMKEITLDNGLDFTKKYLIFDEKELAKFLETPSLRTIESSNDELDALKRHSLEKFEPMNYDIAILSDSDKIFVPKHQQEYFNNKYILLKNKGHNIFSDIESYDEILEYSL